MSRPTETIEDAEVASVAAEIRRYLEGSPGAADTLRGIVRWWLRQQRYTEARTTIEQALELLIQQGHVQTDISAQGETVYFGKSADGTREDSDG